MRYGTEGVWKDKEVPFEVSTVPLEPTDVSPVPPLATGKVFDTFARSVVSKQYQTPPVYENV